MWCVPCVSRENNATLCRTTWTTLSLTLLRRRRRKVCLHFCAILFIFFFKISFWYKSCHCHCHMIFSTRAPADDTPETCIYSNWSPWSACSSATCEKGKRMRQRMLKAQLDLSVPCPHTADFEPCMGPGCSDEGECLPQGVRAEEGNCARRLESILSVHRRRVFF